MADPTKTPETPPATPAPVVAKSEAGESPDAHVTAAVSTETDPSKRYVVVSGKHHWVDDNGIEQVSRAGDEVPAKFVNLKSFGDRFKAI